jgi:hypothetical protein
MISTITSKLRNFAIQKPPLVTIGIGMAISFAIGAAIGILDMQSTAAATTALRQPGHPG